MNPDRTYQLKREIVFKTEGDGGFLFDPRTGNLKYLNATAKEILLLLDGRNDVGGIVRRVEHLYADVSQKTIADDVSRFLNDLESNRFIESSR